MDESETEVGLEDGTEEEHEDVGVDQEEAAEVVVEVPVVPRTRRMPRHFEGMVDERTNLPKGRYKHKTAPEIKDIPELEEEEEEHRTSRSGGPSSFQDYASPHPFP